LSYTTFEYGKMNVDKTNFSGDEKVTVTVSVTNTGDRDGHHAVELFSRDDYASVSPCVKRLRAFDKKLIKAGATESFSFTIDSADLSFINFKSERITEKGTFSLFIDDQSASIRYE
jgi:beta-glucosidase